MRRINLVYAYLQVFIMLIFVNSIDSEVLIHVLCDK